MLCPHYPPPLPREHGAWGLLFQPFFAAALLAGTWSWFYAPALGLALLGFLLREPLVVFLRHHYLWKKPSPESRSALLWVLWGLLGILLCLGFLLPVFPLPLLVALAAAGLVLTVASVTLTLRNQQRSITLQVASAAGLGSTALLAVLAATGGLPGWVWLLWALLTAHAVAAIPVVHARLRYKARHPGAARLRWIAAALQVPAFFLLPAPLLAPVAFSAATNLFELWRVPATLAEPLKRVGLRLLFFSLAHTALAMAVLWPLARP